MKHICLNCKKDFEGRKNKLYCSDKCRERQRFMRRKDNPDYRNAHHVREKRWYNKTGKNIRLKYHRNKSFRNYQNEWRREKKYWLEQYEKHPETEKRKRIKHARTLKGKLSRLRANEKRRKRNILLIGSSRDFLSPKDLKIIDERDIVCVYCGDEFNKEDTLKKPTYDHFNFKKPLTLDNTVKCCWSCNSSKLQVPLEKISEWIKRKRFIPSPIVMELINKKLNTN